MRITCSRCRTVEYTVTVADAGRGVGDLEPVALSAATGFADCLLVKLGVERGDAALADVAAKIVHRMAVRTDAVVTVIDGFARRATARGSDRYYCRGRGADTTGVLQELAERLEERGHAVHLVPAGWSKSWEAEPLEYPGAQCVVDLTAGNDPVIWSSDNICGWNSLCGPLFRP